MSVKKLFILRRQRKQTHSVSKQYRENQSRFRPEPGSASPASRPHLWSSPSLPLSVSEAGHSWVCAVCWRAARRSRRRWKWPARATPPTWTSWWETSTGETTSASACRAAPWRPGECLASVTWGSHTRRTTSTQETHWVGLHEVLIAVLVTWCAKRSETASAKKTWPEPCWSPSPTT